MCCENSDTKGKEGENPDAAAAPAEGEQKPEGEATENKPEEAAGEAPADGA